MQKYAEKMSQLQFQTMTIRGDITDKNPKQLKWKKICDCIEIRALIMRYKTDCGWAQSV